MKRVYQRGTHDCFRACVASCLNLDWGGVPDFYERTPDGYYLSQNDRAAMDKWFSTRDLAYVEMAWPMEPSELMSKLAELHPLATYILMGSSLNGNSHAVVARAGQVLHDPKLNAPSSLSVTRACPDGYSRAGFIIVNAPDVETIMPGGS